MNFKNNSKNIALWIIIGLLLISLFNVFHGNLQKEVKFIEVSDFIQKIEDGYVKEVTIRGDDISGVYQNGEKFASYVPMQYSDLFTKKLQERKNIVVRGRPAEGPSPSFFSIFLNLFPLLLLGGIWFIFSNRLCWFGWTIVHGVKIFKCVYF